MNAYLVVSIDEVRQLLSEMKRKARLDHGDAKGYRTSVLYLQTVTDSRNGNQISSSSLMEATMAMRKSNDERERDNLQNAVEAAERSAGWDANP